MKTERYFKDYRAFHRTKGNLVSHIIGIPLIVMTLFGLLNRVVLVPNATFYGVQISLGLVLWICANGFYLHLHYGLGLTMVITTGALYFLGIQLSLTWCWGLFIFGWVAQFVGHYVYEKKSPAFMGNVIHLFIGPIYIQNYFLKIKK